MFFTTLKSLTKLDLTFKFLEQLSTSNLELKKNHKNLMNRQNIMLLLACKKIEYYLLFD